MKADNTLFRQVGLQVGLLLGLVCNAASALAQPFPADCKEPGKARQIVAMLESRQEEMLKEDTERNARLSKQLEQQTSRAGMDRAARSRFMAQIQEQQAMRDLQAQRAELSGAINQLAQIVESHEHGSPSACANLILLISLEQKLREVAQKEYAFLLQEIGKLRPQNQDMRRSAQP